MKRIITLLTAAIFILSPIVVQAAQLKAGDLAPRGAPDGELNAADILILQRLVNGQISATASELLKGDTAPVGAPDGVIDGVDVLALQRAVKNELALSNVSIPTPTLNAPVSYQGLPVMFTGTASPLIDLDVYVDEAVKYSIVADSDGFFNVTVDFDFLNGTHEVFVVAKADGVLSAISNAVYINYQQSDWIGGSNSRGQKQKLTAEDALDLQSCNEYYCSDEAIAAGAVAYRLVDVNGQMIIAYYNDKNYGELVGTALFDLSEETEPVAAEVVGSLPGNFSVSPSGSATYAIPIEVPPGINGQQPDFSLAYDSQSGNGPLGIGWALSGLSSIQRCPQTYAQDGKVHGVDYTNQDRLCLDGQRLVVTNGQPYWSSSAIYHTEIESYVEVTPFGTGFKVKTKSGVIIEYGNTVDSNQNVFVVTTGETPTLSWKINKSEDVSGNEIIYKYSEDISNGDHYIKNVTYGGNSGQSLAPSLEIEFVYINQQNNLQTYMGGALVKVTKQLSRINVLSNETLVRKYKLTYDYQLSEDINVLINSSRLINIVVCDGSSPSNCFPANVFNWQNGGSGKFNNAIGQQQYGLPANMTNHMGDVDGDGLADVVRLSTFNQEMYVYLSKGDGTFKNANMQQNYGLPAHMTNHLADVNGDGLADVVRLSTFSQEMYVYLSKGDGTFKNAIMQQNYGSPGNMTNHLADVNGDGLTDVVRLSKGSQLMYIYLSKGDGTFRSAISDQNYGAPASMTNHIGDVNGDGLADVVRLSTTSQQMYVYLSKGDGTFWGAIDQQNYGTMASATNSLADVNGDGRDDVVRWDNNSQRMFVYLSRGDGMFEDAIDQQNYGNVSTMTNDMADVNGDGLADVVRMDTASQRMFVHLGKGDGRFNDAVDQQNYGSLPNMTNHLADVDGDGLTDAIRLATDSQDMYVYLAKGKSTIAVKTITDSYGVQTAIDYTPLTDDSIYVKATGASYPLMDFQGSIKVVTRVAVDNGLGSSNASTYKYGKQKIHLLGRGSLGFKWTETTDEQTGINTRVNYVQGRLDASGKLEPDFPHVGSVLTSKTKLSNGVLLNSLTNTLAETPASPSASYIAQSIKIENDLDKALNGQTVSVSTVQKNNTLDQYGNPVYEKIISTEADLTTHQKEISRVFNVSGASLFEKSQLLSQTTTSTGVDGVSKTNNMGYAYNALGLLQSETREPGVPEYELVKSKSYDPFGNVSSTTISGAGVESRTSLKEYDASARFPVKETNVLGHVVERTFDPILGVMLTEKGVNGLTTERYYDSFGRPVKIISPNGTMIVITRDWCLLTCKVPAIDASLLEQTISHSETMRFLAADGVTEYQPAVTKYIDPLGREVRTATTGFDGETLYKDVNYNTLGQITAVTQVYDVVLGDKNPTLNTAYDLSGRLRQQVSPENGVTDISYSSLVMTTTNNGRINKETRNVIGQIVSVTDAMNKVQTYQYDAKGNRTKTTDSLGNLVTVDYDAIGRKVSMNDPDMGYWQYGYDVYGQLISQTDARDQVTSFEYDKLGRMIRRVDDDNTETVWNYNDDLTGGGTPTIATGKLDSERITSPVSNSFDMEKIYSYTSYGQLAQMTTNIEQAGPLVKAYVISTSYDEYGRVDTVAYPRSTEGASTLVETDRLKVKYSYQNGVLKTVSKADDSLTYWTADARDARGQLLMSTYGNGVVNTSQYDNAGRTTLTSVNLGSYFIGDYDYDAIGNLNSQSITHGVGTQETVTETFGYDLLNRVTSVTPSIGAAATIDYDELGNITNKNGEIYQYGTFGSTRPHAVSQVGAMGYLYDANGNLIIGNGRSLAWSAFNKPVQIENTAARINFKYGSDRSRYQQTKLDKVAGTTDTITYVGGLFEIIEKPSVTEFKHYVKAGSDTVAMHVRRSNATDETTYLHKDRLGSLVVVTNQAGDAIANFAYDVFGAPKAIPGYSPGVSEQELYSRRYTGHEQLNEVELIHMNGRVYDPTLGRFISADPYIQFENNQQSYNRYSYVLNNPLSYTDPSGYNLVRAFKSTARFLARTNGVYLSTRVVKSVMYSNEVKGAFMRHKWARQLGQIGAGVADGLTGCTGCFSAAFAGYLTDIAGGSRRDIGKAVALTAASAKLFSDFNGKYQYSDGTQLWTADRVIGNAVIGGTVSHVGGGSFRDGFLKSGASAFAKYAFNGMRQLTNAASAKSGNTLTDPETGELFTYGGRTSVDVDGCDAADQTWLPSVNMTQEIDGEMNSWWDIGWIRKSFNSISKSHDWGNSWNYDAMGRWVSHGAFGDSLFQLYSASTMIPAAIFTGYAHISTSSISSHRYLERKNKYQ